ncbi:MAG: TIR domain-containing protein [Verrucomicrobia bacterium]|nr:TIR domain-containing protein [Verrucomicrobiota bacterium]
MSGRRLACLIDASRVSHFPGHPTSSADIERLKEVLSSAEIGQFSVSAVANPDEERAKAAIREFFGGSQPDDVLLLYFVGYLLVARDDRFWFALATTDPSAVEKTSISAELVLGEIKAAAAHNIVVVLDAQIGVHQESLPLGPWDHHLQVEDKCEAILAASAGPDFFLLAPPAVAQLPANSSLTELIDGFLELRKNEHQITVAELALHLGTRMAANRSTVVTRMDDSSGAIILAPLQQFESESARTEAAAEINSETSGKSSLPEENVQFTVYRPATLVAGRWHRMLVFTHIDEAPDQAPDELTPAQEVSERAQRILAEEFESYRQLATDSQFPVPREGEVTLIPEVPKVTFNPPRRSFIWATDLRVHDESFLVRAPNDLTGSLARGRLSIFLGHLLLADIAITFRIESVSSNLAASEQQWNRSSTRPFRKVFASYSHRDVQIVKAMEHHVKALGYEYLRDVVHLRSGEPWSDRLLGLINDADIFQLFWSSNSARSTHVEREWRYALGLSREAFVRPAFWEVPMPAPPESLRSLHFYRLPALAPVLTEETPDPVVPPAKGGVNASPPLAAQAAEIVCEYGPFPGVDHVGGVSYDGQQVWLATGDKLNALDPASGKMLRSIAVPARAGTAFAGQHLYQIEASRIQKIDPKTSRVLSTIPTPGDGCSGLAWAEGTLWVGLYEDRKIAQIDPETGAVLHTIEADRCVTGITWVDGELWHGTWDDTGSELRRVDPRTGEVLEKLEMPPGVGVSGLESDGRDQFFCGGGSSGKLRIVRRPKRHSAPSSDSENPAHPKSKQSK